MKSKHLPSRRLLAGLVGTTALAVASKGAHGALVLPRVPSSGLQNIKEFDSAAGTPGMDHTELLQGAMDWCSKVGTGLELCAGEFLVTRSLSVGSLKHLRGLGRGVTQIIHSFSSFESYPVIDMGGNSRGLIESLTVMGVSGSHAQCGIFISKGAGRGSSGNAQYVRDCEVKASAGSLSHGVVILNSDLSRVIDCTIQGGQTGLSIGNGAPRDIKSKFYFVSKEYDFTQAYVTRCELLGERGGALVFTGGACLNVSDTYCATVGVGHPYIVEVNAATPNSGNSLFCRGLRTENQSHSKGVVALQFTTKSFGGSVEGVLQTDLAGAMIGGGPVSEYDFHVIGGTPLFRMSAPLDRVNVFAHALHGDLGNVGPSPSGVHVVGGNLKM